MTEVWCDWCVAWLDICFLLYMPGDNGLSEDLQGGETPETVSEGRRVEPETKVGRCKEEQPDERRR